MVAARWPSGGGSVNRGNFQILPQTEGRAHAFERRDRDGAAPVAQQHPGRHRSRQRFGGNQQMNRFLSGGNNGGGRLSLEIRGENSDECAARCRRQRSDLLDQVPGVADARMGRDEGRPELSVRVDRAKAAPSA